MTAQPHTAPSRLSFGTLNVNGLGDAKRRALFHGLAGGQRRVDVMFLQETHHASQQAADVWVQEGAGPGLPFRGASVWAAGTSSSRGAAVLVGHHLRAEAFQSVHVCPKGRIAGALLSLPGGNTFLLYSVYAPCVGAERAAFFTGPLRTALADGVRRHPGARLVLGGDFNCVESALLDVGVLVPPPPPGGGGGGPGGGGGGTPPPRSPRWGGKGGG